MELERTESHSSSLEQDEQEPISRVSSSVKSLDLEYRQSSRTVEEHLVSGLSNDDLWLLIRRFNKQIYYVKAAEDVPPKELDLTRTEDEHYPPEKMRMTLERFYISVIVGAATFFNHITRLRSWKEPKRTSVFCGVYFITWLFDILVPTTCGMLVVLILFRPSRALLFPSAPAVHPDPESDGGNLNSEPQSYDSITGAPENHKGEAAEQEASNWVNGIAGVAIESAAGKYGQAVAESQSPESPPPDTMEVVTTTGDTQTEDVPAEDKTKQPMKKKVNKTANQTMRAISDITDLYERLANVFSPTPPFTALSPRLQLAGIMISVALGVYMTSSYFIIKLVAFAVGFGFFGDPIFTCTLDFLNNKIPDWKKHMDLNNTLLKGVPTNAQLTLTLLRIGEVNSSPLPPPPTSKEEPLWPVRRKKSDKSSITSPDKDKEQDISQDLQRRDSTDSDASKPKSKRRWISKVLKFVRRTVATAIKGHIAMDRAMAIAGSAHTKNLAGMVGMLRQKGFVSVPFGPLKFDAKFERKRGAVVIDSSKEPPVLYFTTYQSSGLDDLRLESRKKGSVLFQIPVTDIRELKKTEGLGWKGKLIVELTAGSKEAADGLVIQGKEPEQSYHLTGMRSRNQLFNRLVAIDAQFWENC